jgi:EAL domain-containing protein (putative c-di-GMP-specific phosphodiesterase class I)/FixJ family two-component response regulator
MRRELRAAAIHPGAHPDPLEPELREALANGRLRLDFQPQADLRTGRVVGFEALARWDDSPLGPVPPSRFIAAAEQSDLALALGRWALLAACRQLAEWSRQGHREVRVSVNLSGRHFTAEGMVEQVNEALAASGADPRRLQIEITENTLIGNLDRAVGTMRRLAALGVQFALDDFGTGYSSLTYLRRFPIHEVKIDRSFVAEMTERTEDAVIVRTIIAMAHALGTRVVAEGVETEAQLAALRRARCDIAQGFLVARPAPAAELDALLAAPRALAELPGAGGERTLLVVDDEPNIASSLRRLLRGDGYRILTAHGAAEGFELLARNEVGVIISDQRMPAMCGTEFLSRVKDMYPGTLRMVLSGFTDLESVTGAINEGAIFKFLTKPWEDDAIRATVRDAFERHELLRENERLGEEARRANRELSEANAALERRVAEKTEALERQLAVLRVSQEALDRLPLGVIGVDAEGMIAAANEYAVIALAAAPGTPASECLAPALLGVLERSAATGGEARDAHEEHTLICRPMGGASAARGQVLVAVPATH